MISTTKIFLADLAHTYGVADHVLTMPLGIGYVKAYAIDALGDSVDIRLFKHPERFLAAVHDQQPHVIGFANYGWNQNLNREIGRYVRKAAPRALIVAGGPNIDPGASRRAAFMAKHDYLDFLIVDGGEEPFTDLVKWNREDQRDFGRLPSNVVWRDGDTVRATKERALKKIIEHLPSPYLGGHLDEFLDAGLIPLFETNRGCPFRCTFCAWGSASKNLVRRIDLDQAIAEVKYVGERSNARHWIICDANFGILPRDLEIAQAIRKVKDTKGRPRTCDIWLAKNVTDRCLAIGEVLGDMAVPVMAVQSLDEEVLRHIKRDNISLDTYEQYQQKFHKIGSRTYSDLIVPLPSETLDSHLGALRTLMTLGVDIIQNHNMRLLAGAETNSDETRERFQFRTKYRLIHGDAGMYRAPDGSTIRSFEHEESLRSTNTMSEAEVFWLRKLHFMVDFAWNIEVYKPMLDLGLCHGVNPVDVMLKVVHHKSLEPFFEHFDRCSSEEWYDDEAAIQGYFFRPENFQRLINREFEKLNIQFSVIALQLFKRMFDAAMSEALREFDAVPVGALADTEALCFALFPPLDQEPPVPFVETESRKELRSLINKAHGTTLSKILNTNGISLRDLKLTIALSTLPKAEYA